MINKPQLLDLLQLLSAIESWSFSTGARLPDFLIEQLNSSVDLIRDEILKEVNG